MARSSPPPKTTARLRRARFTADNDPWMDRIHVSVDFDRRLAREDIDVSIAHCRMLEACGIINKDDARAICAGLTTIGEEIRDGHFVWKREHEDVHINIEARLEELIGKAALRLHTARSRNDQVACDLRLWIRRRIDELDRMLRDLQESLIKKAESHHDTVMPGFTHLQTAQQVTFGHHLLAYTEMFGRDRDRLSDCRRRLDESPLGAAALAGTSFAIDRTFSAQELGFARVMVNSLDAVSSRDFACEFIAVAALSAVHMSRIGEEIVLWMSQPFSFITLSDAWSTGSSIMPHKRNPDAAELVRGKSGTIFAQLTSLLTTLKGLPLAYSKDMQEDKIPVFNTFDTWSLCLHALKGMIDDMTVRKERMAEVAKGGRANDLADLLVQKADMPFRQAYEYIATLVRIGEDQGKSLSELTLAQMQDVCPAISQEMYDDADGSPDKRTSFGGTAPKRVQAAAKSARKRWLD